MSERPTDESGTQTPQERAPTPQEWLREQAYAFNLAVYKHKLLFCAGEMDRLEREIERLCAQIAREACIVQAARVLAPLLEAGWDEYDADEDQRAGEEACDALINAVNAEKRHQNTAAAQVGPDFNSANGAQEIQTVAEPAPAAAPIPDAYLVTFKEEHKGGQRRCCTIASLEPSAPSIRLPEESEVERREVLTVVPLFAASSRKMPKIVCLCGSTRFMDAFFDVGWEETLAGHIVLSVGVCKHAEHHGAEALGPEVVEALDELHKRKIDLADEVIVLNVGGYIGESTRSEIEYAQAHGKPLRYLCPISTAPQAIKGQTTGLPDEPRNPEPGSAPAAVPCPIVGLRIPWEWIQPANRTEIKRRLLEARDFNVPARERENMCSVAHAEIVELEEEIERLRYLRRADRRDAQRYRLGRKHGLITTTNELQIDAIAGLL